MKNLPVVDFSAFVQQKEKTVVSMKGIRSPSYRQVVQLAEEILSRVSPPIFLCLQQDMAKALGQALAVRLPGDAEILCIDRIRVEDGSYLDIAEPVGSAMPVVVKTLVLSK